MENEKNEIEKFTAEDFVSSTLPYEYLNSFKNNPLKLAQMTELLKSQAKKVGIMTFVSLNKAYLEMIGTNPAAISENYTDFTGQPVELISGEYICDDTGVYYYDKLGLEYEVCKHPIMPTQRLINIDTGEEKLNIAYRKGRIWRNVIVEKAVLSSPNKIIELANKGVFVTASNAGKLGEYLLTMEELNYDILPEKRSVERLGWIKDCGFSPYVDELMFDGDMSFKHIFRAVSFKGSEEEWTNKMREVRKSSFAARMFLASSFASVLVEPCGLLPFFVHAWGGTECGKTVGLMVASSVWGDPTPGEYITTFNSTSVAQEMQASFLNSLPMCLDELQIQSSQGMRDFDRMIYMLCEGVGKGRGAKVGGLQKNRTWRNCILTNGEQPISRSSSAGGAVNRILEFECTEKIYDDLVGLCDTIKGNYGFAGRKFVEYLQTDEGMREARRRQKEFYKVLTDGNSTDKQSASASAVLTADSIATDIIFKDGNALTVCDMAAIMTDRDTVNANRRALEYIYQLVAQNPNRFYQNANGDFQGEVWGKVENDCVYILKKVFDEKLEQEGYNTAAFLAWAARNKKIKTDSDRKRYTKVTRIRGIDGAIRCVCVVRDEDTDGVTESEGNYDYDDFNDMF